MTRDGKEKKPMGSVSRDKSNPVQHQTQKLSKADEREVEDLILKPSQSSASLCVDGVYTSSLQFAVESIKKCKQVILDDRYVLSSVLGQGQAIYTFEALHQELNLPRVVKIAREEGLERLVNHRNILSQLDIAGVPQIYDSRIECDTSYTVEQLVGTSGLNRFIDLVRKAKQSSEEFDWYSEGCDENAVTIWMPVLLDTLKELHEQDILHRDIKPSNIRFYKEKIFLLDFDVSRKQDLENTLSKDDLKGFSANYMAPEVRMGEEHDKRSDLWQLAATMFETLTQSMPISTTNPQELASGKLKHDYSEFFAKALNMDPDKRFQTAEEMKKAFIELMQENDVFGGGYIIWATQREVYSAKVKKGGISDPIKVLDLLRKPKVHEIANIAISPSKEEIIVLTKQSDYNYYNALYKTNVKSPDVETLVKDSDGFRKKDNRGTENNKLLYNDEGIYLVRYFNGVGHVLFDPDKQSFFDEGHDHESSDRIEREYNTSKKRLSPNQIYKLVIDGTVLRVKAADGQSIGTKWSGPDSGYKIVTCTWADV